MEILCLDLEGKPSEVPHALKQVALDDETLLDHYASISISFDVNEIFAVERIDGGLGGLQFNRVGVDKPWTKDYDMEEPPSRWARLWDLENWAAIFLCDQQEIVGGAIIARDTEGVNMLQGRADLAVLWDIRIASSYRHQGLGTLLIDKVMEWSSRKACEELRVETQNINVRACTFYWRMGMELMSVNFSAYRDQPDEVQLIWHIDVGQR